MICAEIFRDFGNLGKGEFGGFVFSLTGETLACYILIAELLK